MSLTWGWEIIVTVTPPPPPNNQENQETNIKQHHTYFQNAKRKAEKNNRTV
jgi:hypothetical protein